MELLGIYSGCPSAFLFDEHRRRRGRRVASLRKEARLNKKRFPFVTAQAVDPHSPGSKETWVKVAERLLPFKPWIALHLVRYPRSGGR
jgi:hypothetical protein